MKTVITTLLLSVYTLAFSQWNEQNPLPQSNTLNGIYFVDDDHGYAVGNSGTLVKTTDAGTTWTTLSIAANATLNAVCFTNMNTGYVTTNNGDILKTVDAGDTWTTVFAGNNEVFSIDFINAATGFAVGKNGLKLKTTDAGQHWSNLGSDNSTVFYNIMRYVRFLDENNGYLIGASYFCGECTKQQIIKTIDGGATWTETLPYLGGFISGSFPDPTTGYAIGSNLVNGNAVIYKTTDSGTTWTQMAFILAPPNRFTAIHFIDANTGFIGCGNGNIKKTSDGGQTWTDCSVNSSFINSFAFTDENVGYAVGQNGEILKTTNSGGTLDTQSPEMTKANCTLSPNPAENSISITLSKPQQTLEVTVIDPLGNRIIDRKFTTPGEITIDVSQLQQGIYFLQSKTESFTEIKKIIKR